MNKEIMVACGYEKEMDLIEQKICPFCENKVGEFRDDLSRKEYEISGLCQTCQDDFFGEK